MRKSADATVNLNLKSTYFDLFLDLFKSRLICQVQMFHENYVLSESVPRNYIFGK